MQVRHCCFMQYLFAVMAYSISRNAILGKLRLFPAVKDGLIGLTLVPAVIVLIVICVLIFIVLQFTLYLVNGKKYFVIRLIGRLKKEKI